jgi:YVTN family beta-propeller protein
VIQQRSHTDARLSALVLAPALALTAMTAPALTAEARRAHMPDARIAIVNKGQGALTVLSLRDRTRQVFTAGHLPHEAAAAQGVVFVSNYGSAYIRSSDVADRPGNTLSAVDLSRAGPRAEVVDLGPGRCAPHGLAASPDERRLYITCEGRQEILVMDVATRTIDHAIPTNQAGSHMLVVSASGTRAYVANFWHGTVSVLDLQARKIVAHVKTGEGTEGIGLSPDDRYLYTASPVRNEIVKVDTDTLTVVARRFVGEGKAPLRIVPTPGDGRALVVNCADDGTVQIVKAETLELVHDVKVGRLPIGITVPDSRRAYSANMNDGTLSVIDIEKGVVEDTIDAGELPDGIVYLPNP